MVTCFSDQRGFGPLSTRSVMLHVLVAFIVNMTGLL